MEDQRRTIQEKKQKLKYALDGMDNMVVIISYFIVLNQSSVSIKEKISLIWKEIIPTKTLSKDYLTITSLVMYFYQRKNNCLFSHVFLWIQKYALKFDFVNTKNNHCRCFSAQINDCNSPIIRDVRAPLFLDISHTVNSLLKWFKFLFECNFYEQSILIYGDKEFIVRTVMIK